MNEVVMENYDDKLLFTPQEVAQLLRIKPVTVNSWLRTGKLQGHKVGGRLWRITREQLEEFITFDLDDLLRKQGRT